MIGNAPDKMFHVLRLALNQRPKVNNDPLGFITLTRNLVIRPYKLAKLLLVLFPFALEIFGNFLLHNQGFEGLVALLLGTGETDGEVIRICLLLFNKPVKPLILLLMRLDLGLKIRRLLGKLSSKGLEFLKLHGVSNVSKRTKVRRTCCFQLSTSSIKKLFRLDTFCISVSIRPLRLM